MNLGKREPYLSWTSETPPGDSLWAYHHYFFDGLTGKTQATTAYSDFEPMTVRCVYYSGIIDSAMGVFKMNEPHPYFGSDALKWEWHLKKRELVEKMRFSVGQYHERVENLDKN